MVYALIDNWLQDFCDENELDEKDVMVDVFSQPVAENGAIKPTQITVIREKNCEVVDVYFGEDFKYTIYGANNEFLEDLKNHELKNFESGYQS